MKSLNYTVMFIPVIALSLCIFFYLLLLKKADKKAAFKQLSWIILVTALVLNFIWEMAQMPLFKDMPLTWEATVFCALAAIADAIMVMLLYYSYGLIYNNSFWFKRATGLQIFFLVLAGGIGAVLAEKRHLDVGTWAYSSTMPIVPIVEVGLSPVLQFILLPLVIFGVAFKLIHYQIK